MRVEKFPVPFRREFSRKLLNLLAQWILKWPRSFGICEIPCKFHCYQRIWGGDWFDQDFIVSQPIRSPRSDFGVCENWPHSGGLGRHP